MSRDVTYQHLARALSANLRRQILLAVCEVPDWRDRLNTRLSVEHPADAPPLVDLELDPEQPNFPTAIAHWLQTHPQHPNAIFAVRGVEALTRQPAAIQQRFLRQLHLLDRHLPQLDFNLLLWLTRPWCNTIRDSVPEFWRWHTGLFEFADEPAEKHESPLGLTLQPPPAETACPLDSRRVPAHKPNPRPARSFQKRPGEVPLLTLAPTPDRRTEAPVISDAPAREQQTAMPPQAEAACPPTATPNAPMEQPVEQPREKLPPGSPCFCPRAAGSFGAPASPPPAPTIPAALSLADVARLTASQPPAVIAQAYLQVGQQHRDRIAQGEVSPAQLSAAIQAYEQAAQWLTDEPETAEVLNDLGNFYWLRSRQPEQPEMAFPDLEQALSTYQIALNQLAAPEAQPEIYAMIQNNLGAAYGDLARYRDLVENLQLSIAAYQAALKFRQAENEPLKYASTQNNLGTAYWHLAQQAEPAMNLRAAIQAYQAASPFYREDSDPQSWAMIQNNLGTAYWNLSQYDEPDAWLPEAIAHYEASLRYRTPAALPAACAATQNNLGTAYWQLSQLADADQTEEVEFLQRAIAAYTVATTIAQQLHNHQPPLLVSFDFLGTLNNLGSVHYQLGTTEHFELPGDRRIAHLEAALQAHLQALSQMPPDSVGYANTFKLVARCVRACYDQQGLEGQNRALAQVPGQLLPELLPKL
ncbi:MAG: tetratricopeptide repeat protein [Spirulinaceae cyanobacterium RM2_2_10]|nr:tetratricopeptide repeat protein [Spirulinaceae cyanobacterium RM2_2_10]